ncbi:MAG: hypothetical protein IJO86_01010 [Oscillospiraceae bacterium]|nr:hypothetical protein [Oscillospiraceae bacterium]
MEQKLRLGAAYHGNRMPHHALADLSDMATHGMDLVVHMFSHTDWDRHKNVMRDIIKMSEDVGLESWVDNWGLGGPPGDKSHFLAYYPDSHIYLSNGEMDPVRACLNSPDFRKFTKEWIDAVEYLGAKTIFWDEPHMPRKTVDGKTYYGCTCPRCKELFFAKYGREMPEFADDDTQEFAAATITDYFREVTEYSAKKGMKNVVCVMLGTYGMSLDASKNLCALPNMDNIGSDPYWLGAKARNPELNVYEFVYKETKRNLEFSSSFNKDHNVWIQTYNNPRGMEEDIILATEAAYDAGARTILAWGYYGSESNDYGAKNPAVTWAKTCEAMQRVRTFERDRILKENRARFMK